MVSGRPAVVTGLLGLDVEHGAISEVHPTHALAIQTGCGRPDGGSQGPYLDRWVFFVRNSGNEGWCSQWDLQHRLDPHSGVFTVALPAAFSGAIDKAELVPTSEIFANVAGVRRSPLELKDGRLVLRLRWPDGMAPDDSIRIHGTLDVRWWPKPGTGAACLDVARAVQDSPTDPVAAGSKPGPPEEKDESAEAFLRSLRGPQPRGAEAPSAFRVETAAAALDQASVTVEPIPEVSLRLARVRAPATLAHATPGFGRWSSTGRFRRRPWPERRARAGKQRSCVCWPRLEVEKDCHQASTAIG
jgi:hypothetical protein